MHNLFSMRALSSISHGIVLQAFESGVACASADAPLADCSRERGGLTPDCACLPRIAALNVCVLSSAGAAVRLWRAHAAKDGAALELKSPAAPGPAAAAPEERRVGHRCCECSTFRADSGNVLSTEAFIARDGGGARRQATRDILRRRSAAQDGKQRRRRHNASRRGGRRD
jgi:hypothetical protein